jgi:hypothetical protein
MRGSADMAGMPDVRSRAFFRFEIARHHQPMEMKLESSPDFSHSEMRAPRGPSFGSRNEVYFATSQHAPEIVAPEASHSRASFLNIRLDPSYEGERCMKDTDHPFRHLLRHLRIFERVRNRRSCAWHNDQFGRGQNTGLGWSDPTFVHVSVPKVIRGVAPAQLRGDRAEYFVRVQMGRRTTSKTVWNYPNS